MSRRRRRRRRARASAVGFSSCSARLVFFFFRFAAPLLENTSASVRRSADVRRCSALQSWRSFFAGANNRVCDSEIRHYRRSRNTNENRAPDRSFVFPARVDDSKTVRDASLVFHTEDWRELGAGRLCVWERKRPARLLERRQRRARKHTFDRRSHVSRAASSSRASVRSSAFKRNLPRRGVRRCAAAHAKPHARRPAGVA